MFSYSNTYILILIYILFHNFTFSFKIYYKIAIHKYSQYDAKKFYLPQMASSKISLNNNNINQESANNISVINESNISGNNYYTILTNNNKYTNNTTSGTNVTSTLRKFKITLKSGLFSIKKEIDTRLKEKFDSIIQYINSPLLDKSIATAVGYAIGDILAQLLTHQFHISRLIRMTLFGFLIHGTLGFFFYPWLMNRFNGKDVSAVAKRVLVDQLLFVPSIALQLIIFIGILKGYSPYQIYLLLKDTKKVLILLGSNWIIWPVSHYINFQYIPIHQRQIFINFIQVIINMLQSIIVNQH